MDQGFGTFYLFASSIGLPYKERTDQSSFMYETSIKESFFPFFHSSFYMQVALPRQDLWALKQMIEEVVFLA